MCDTLFMINEPEKRNVPVAFSKFITWMLILISVGWFMISYVQNVGVEYNTLAERLVKIL